VFGTIALILLKLYGRPEWKWNITNCLLICYNSVGMIKIETRDSATWNSKMVSRRGKPINGKYGVATEPCTKRSSFLRKIKVGIPYDVKIGDPSQSEA